MAVFEKKKEDRVLIDDTMPFTCDIVDAVNTKGFVEYRMKVSRLPDVDKSWVLSHRYSEFRDLYSCLNTPTIKLPPLPPKRYFGNQNKEFINERKTLLQEYMDSLLKMPFISVSPHIKRFLDPMHSSGKFIEEAHEHLLESLRAGGRHIVTQTVPCMGTRLRKHYFIGHPFSDPRVACSFWFAPYGPDKALSIKDIHPALTALVHCKHPLIVSPISCIATDAGACAIRPWFRQGSLRDYIYCVKPQFHFLLKYTNNRKRNMPIKTCAVYARQILEVLHFLHERGIGHGALHSGNIVVENNVCQLMDLENQLLGLPHPLRPHFVSLKKINSIESIDVYSFGHLLYEMVFNEPLQTETCSSLPEDLYPLCRSVFESILSPEACKNGLPSVADLLTHPFFNEVPLHSFEKPTLKLTSAVRLSFKSSYEKMISRLKEDQKKMKLLRQISRGEEVISNQPRMKQKSSKPKHDTISNNSQNSLGPDVSSPIDTSNLNEPQTTEDRSPKEGDFPCYVENNNENGDTNLSITPESREEFLSSIHKFNRSSLRKSSQSQE